MNQEAATLKIDMPVITIFPEEIPRLVKAIKETDGKDLRMEKELFDIITGNAAVYERKVVSAKWVSDCNDQIKRTIMRGNEYLLLTSPIENEYEKEEDREKALAAAEKNILLVGSAAVLVYAKMNNPDFHHAIPSNLTFHIPLSVMSECSSESWKDICSLAMRLGLRSDRLSRMIELKAPGVILLNEYRMLVEAVFSLEDNGRTYYGEQVRPCFRDPECLFERRSLRDVGYSLLNGWDKQMLEHFDKMAEEIPYHEDEDDDEEETCDPEEE